ncbi:MAG TPA: sialate O-acetylesterase, partial [Mariniflexile sp.]
MKRLIIIAFLSFLTSFNINAQIKLPALFTDHMMLQQDMDAPIWGWANKNEKITVLTSWDSKAYEAKTDSYGKWLLKVKTPEADYTTYNITVSQGENSITINNILIGEVWLCSGQSNMEMPLKG